MNPGVTHYDRNCLRRLLDETLPEPLASEVAEHVADCADCRSDMELLAGQPQWWSQTCSDVKAILAEPQAYLSSGDDLAGLSSAERKTGNRPHDLSDESFASDFAVDFLEPSDNPSSLGRLGEYEIVEVIGRGGMGIVLKGFQKELNRYVAVKVLAPHLSLSAAARRRFAREAQATAAIVNPHVMAIHAVAANAKLPYLVMPFVACESLQQRLDRQGPLDVKDVLRIGLQAASGLAAAHAQGLVHRDVKPANILLETSVERVMLTDFGLARAVDDATLTRTGIIAGTPQYMSPEQANGDAVDPRSDLFSLGSVLYAMCTARPPFRADSTFGVLRRIRETSPRPIREINADIPEWLERIVMKLLSKSPDDRIASATQTATLLEQCLAHVQQPTTVPLPADVSLQQGIRSSDSANRKWQLSQIAAVALLIGGIATWAIWFRTKPQFDDGQKILVDQSTADDSLLEWDNIQMKLDATANDVERLNAEARQELEGLDNTPTKPHPPRGGG